MLYCWNVAILVKEADYPDGKVLCYGTLVHTNVVVTTGKCASM